MRARVLCVGVYKCGVMTRIAVRPSNRTVLFNSIRFVRGDSYRPKSLFARAHETKWSPTPACAPDHHSYDADVGVAVAVASHRHVKCVCKRLDTSFAPSTFGAETHLNLNPTTNARIYAIFATHTHTHTCRQPARTAFIEHTVLGRPGHPAMVFFSFLGWLAQLGDSSAAPNIHIHSAHAGMRTFYRARGMHLLTRPRPRHTHV